jgi:hypothetical protein
VESRVLAGKISGQQLAFSIKPPNQLKPLQNGGKEEAEEEKLEPKPLRYGGKRRPL